MATECTTVTVTPSGGGGPPGGREVSASVKVLGGVALGALAGAITTRR